jgi:cell division protein FtsX
MDQIQVYLKVTVDMEDRDESPDKISAELARVLQRAYGVRSVEISSVVDER